MLSYSILIQESEEQLRGLEKKLVNGYCRDRVRFLRLLKSGQARSQVAAGRQIGLKERQSQRLWQKYTQEGLCALTTVPHQGYQGRFTQEQVETLEERLRQDDVATLRDAQELLSGEFQLDYTLGGVSALFKRLKIKLKTGRSSNVRKDEEQVEGFKKNSPNL